MSMTYLRKELTHRQQRGSTASTEWTCGSKRDRNSAKDPEQKADMAPA